MKNITTLLALTHLALLHFTSTLQSQSDQLLFVGHSLSDRVPEMIYSFGQDEGVSYDYTYCQIIGSPLTYQWSCLRNPSNWPGDFPDGHIYPFYHPTEGLPSGKFNHLILNEGVPRIDNMYGIEETKRLVDSFYQYATSYNPDIQVYLSELWHCLLSGTPTGCHYDTDSNPWRQRLDDDLPMWEKAIDYINDTYNPNLPMRLIPSGQALAAFYDSIYAGKVVGIDSIQQVYDDDIHGNDTIRYLVSCVNYASIFEKSPVGLTNETYTWWGGALGEIPDNLALQLQTIAWETVCQYPHNGINCMTTSTEPFSQDEFVVYPNPNQGTFTISPTPTGIIRMYNLVGKTIFEGSAKELLTPMNFEPGVYYLQFEKTTALTKVVIQ